MELRQGQVTGGENLDWSSIDWECFNGRIDGFISIEIDRIYLEKIRWI